MAAVVIYAVGKRKRHIRTNKATAPLLQPSNHLLVSEGMVQHL